MNASSLHPFAAHRRLPLCGAALLLGIGLQAYPPTPDHVIYGQVRDRFGNPLQTDSAVVFLETTSGTQLNTAVIPGFGPGVNYQLPVPMDAGLAAGLYKPTALRPMVPFTLKVKIGQTTYLPMEMNANYSNLGAPAGRTRIDLTLGEDSDGDGLPDAWERALIAASGRPLTLADVRPNDDFDGDGLSNLQEYLAGTYAFDPQQGFELHLLASDGNASALEFVAVRGRAYTLEGSADFTEWQPLPFRVAAPQPETETRQQYYATDVRLLRVQVLSGAEAMRFFRLRVQ